jgi:hypothetical protein
MLWLKLGDGQRLWVRRKKLREVSLGRGVFFGSFETQSWDGKGVGFQYPRVMEQRNLEFSKR